MISTGRRGTRLAALAAVLVIAGVLSVWASSTEAQPSPCSPGVDCENGMSVSSPGPAPVGAEVDVDVSIDYANTAYVAFQAYIEYDSAVINFVPVGTKNVVYTGLGGMTLEAPAFDSPTVGTLRVTKLGAIRYSGTTTDTGVAAVVRYRCVARGTTILRLVPPEGLHAKSTTIGRAPAVILTELVAGSITCGEPDSDGDGVPDASDNCPGTAPSAEVDVNGCSQAQVDQDLDGVCDPGASSPLWCTGSDICPLEDSTGFDANDDGCIDQITGLGTFIDTLFDDGDGAIDQTMHRSLHTKIDAAAAAATRDNVCAAVNVLDALKNQVEAQTGKKISEEAAAVLLEFISSVQGYMLIVTGVDSC